MTGDRYRSDYRGSSSIKQTAGGYGGKSPDDVYIVDVLLCCLEAGERRWGDNVKPCPPGESGAMEVVPCELNRVDKLSSIRIYLPDNLRSRDVRESCRKTLSEVFERFKNNILLLDPIKDMKISDKEFKRSVRKIDNVEEELTNHELH
eukprot:259954_1